MAKTAPNGPFEGSLGDSPGEKVVHGMEYSSLLGTKMVNKSIKKPFKKTVVFRSGLGRDFLVF